MSIFNILPDELWSIVGDFIFCTIHESEDSISLEMKPARHYTITWSSDGIAEIYPGCAAM
jgi:hypothetical protein